jgi:E3 ubiquitin-protein ligase DOA10
VQNLYHTRYHGAPAAPGSEEISCSICLLEYKEADEIIQLPCDERHFFHAPCITEWLEKNNNCPLCKAPITNEALQQQQQKLQSAG